VDLDEAEEVGMAEKYHSAAKKTPCEPKLNLTLKPE